jgi:amino acid efflux transporter
MASTAASTLTIPRGSALYIGALLGPGLLLVPGLASTIAGPAAIVAWVGMLGLSALFAVVFAALAGRFPSGGGVATYTTVGLGRRAGNASAWCFLMAVVLGAPVVCLVGGNYVTAVAGGGPVVSTAVAAGLLLVVLGLGLRGARTTTMAQLVLVAVLIAVIVVAVVGSAPSARTSNWTPFAPHGWTAVGRAASVVIFSFVGWEAIAPLTPRFRDPARQLPRVIVIAFVVTAVVFLAVGAAPTAVLGAGATGNASLSDLLQVAIGPAGRTVGAAVAIVLTLGTVNAYLTGAVEMAKTLTRSPSSGRRLYYAIAATGLVILGLHALRLVGTAELVTIPTSLFVVVYIGAMGAATRVLQGWSRAAAVPALVVVIGLLAFSGWALALAGAVAVSAAILTKPATDTARRAGSGQQDDLAAAAPVLDRVMSGAGVGEGECATDEDLQLPGVDQAHQFESGGRAHLGARVGPGSAAEHLDAQRRPAAKRENRRDAASVGDQSQARVECLVRAGQIEGDIDPLRAREFAHPLGERGGAAAVGNRLGAERE